MNSARSLVKKVNLYDRKTKNYLVNKCFYAIEEYKEDNIEKKKFDLYFYVLVYIDAILFKPLYAVMLGVPKILEICYNNFFINYETLSFHIFQSFAVLCSKAKDF